MLRGGDFIRAQRLTGFVLFVIAVTAVLSAQTPRQRPLFRAGVDLIEVDVTVVDGDSHPVSDLQASDFSVTVDGEPRRVVQAQFVSLRPPEEDKRATQPAAEDVFYTSNTDQTPGRLIVIAVDEESILFGEGRHVMSAAAEFVDSLNPADRVSLLAIPQPGLHIDFTSDHDRVRREVESMSGLGTRRQGLFDIGVSEAYRIVVYGDQQTFAEVVARVCAGGMVGCPEQVRGEALQIVQVQRFHTRNARLGLESLLAALRELEGPNALLWIAGGFVIEDALNLKEVEKLAAASRTTLYVMMVDGPLIDMSRASRSSTARDDQRMKVRGLMALSSMTRGRLIRARYNPGPLFEQLGRELSGYYLLGVQSHPSDREEARRGIDVSVDREGVQVRARREIGDVEEASDQTVDERLARMLRSPTSIQELPLRVATYAYHDPESEQMRIFAAAEVGVPEGVPSPLTLGIVLRDSEGAAVLTQQQQITARPTQTPNGPVLETSFPLTVSPGKYSLRVAVVDATGQRGSVEHPVRAEVKSSGSLAVGDLLLADQASIRPSGVLAPVEARVTGDRLVVYTELYADSPAIWERTRVHLSIADSAAGPARTQTTVTFDRSEDVLRRVVMRDVAVDDLPPGRYVVRARVEYDSDEVARLHRPFWVTESH